MTKREQQLREYLSEQREKQVGPVCQTCSLQSFGSNGVRITDWDKFLCSPDPCPECMEEWRKSMREYGSSVAKAFDEALMNELEKP